MANIFVEKKKGIASFFFFFSLVTGVILVPIIMLLCLRKLPATIFQGRVSACILLHETGTSVITWRRVTIIILLPSTIGQHYCARQKQSCEVSRKTVNFQESQVCKIWNHYCYRSTVFFFLFFLSFLVTICTSSRKGQRLKLYIYKWVWKFQDCSLFSKIINKLSQQ